MGRVGGDDEDGGSDAGEQDREDRAARGLPDAALPPDEHPLQGLLLQDVPHRPLRQIILRRRHRDARARPIPDRRRRRRESRRGREGEGGVRWRRNRAMRGSDRRNDEEPRGREIRRWFRPPMGGDGAR